MIFFTSVASKLVEKLPPGKKFNDLQSEKLAHTYSNRNPDNHVFNLQHVTEDELRNLNA